MNDFDKELFELSSKEKNVVPEKLDNKINNILNDLPNKKRRKRVPLKVALVAAAITILSVTTVIAATGVGFWERNNVSDYESNKGNIERLSVPIALSDSDKGINLTVDNVAVDDNYMYVFYTLESNNNLKELGNEYSYGKPLNPFFYISIDEILNEGQDEFEGNFISDNTYKGVQRISVIDKNIKESFDLKVSADKIGSLEGDWSISTKVERKDSSLATKTITPNISGKVNRNGQLGDYTVDKIVLSTLGNQIQITEEQYGVDAQFMLFDDKGNELPLYYQSFRKNDVGKSTNTFEFITQNKDLDYIRLVPYKTINLEVEPKEVSVDIESLPKTIKTSDIGKFTIEEVIKEKNVMKIKYKLKGQNGFPAILLLDGNGERINHGGVLAKTKFDRITGTYTEVFTFYDEKFDLNSIKKIGTFYSDDVKLLEDQALEIPLK